jgi:hypothetical protein
MIPSPSLWLQSRCVRSARSGPPPIPMNTLFRKSPKSDWKLPGGTITLLPLCGRVLQVEVADCGAYWVNAGWTGDWNAGGDRLWLAPEVDWHWKTRKAADFAQYEVQGTVDPGAWDLVAQSGDFCQVRQNARLRNRHRQSEVTVEMSRCFSVAELSEAPFFKSWLAYRTDNEVTIVKGTRGQRLGLWSLLQVPGGGEVIIAGRESPAFRTHFGCVPKALLKHRRQETRFEITGRHQFKVGLSAAVLTGRMAYVRPVNEGYLVIYRQFFPQPWRTYCDVPMQDLKSQGDAVQIYNDGGEFGGFGEMEYHSPMIEVGRGTDRLLDSNLTVIGWVSEKAWLNWKRHWLFGPGGARDAGQ